jgi:outer membrane usher protein
LSRGLERAALALALAATTSHAAADGTRLLEVWIDGASTQRVERFERTRDGRVLAARALWRSFGLAAGDGDEHTPVAADELPGVQARLDDASQTLRVERARDGAQRTVIERWRATAGDSLPTRSGLLLNYDVVATHAKATSAAGLVELRAFGPAGVLEHHLVAAAGDTRLRTRRLQTTYTYADPARAQRLRVGDVATGALAWTRALRLAGVQHLTDYSLQPERIVAPTVQLAGQVALPSTVDLLVDGVRQASQPVDAGAFELRQVPVPAGAGEVTLVVRDALGRQTLQSLPVYGAARQLGAGIGEHALQLGRVRRGLSDYAGTPAASGTLRRGSSDRVTVEAHAEATSGLLQAGAGVQATWWPVGTVNAAAAASRDRGLRGHLMHLGWERRSRAWSAQAAWTHTSAGYRDLAARHGDAPARDTLRLALGADLGRWGRASVFALQQDKRLPLAAATRLVGASQQWTLGSGQWQLLASGWRDSGGARAHSGLQLALTLPLGERGHAGAAWSRERGRASVLSAHAGVPAALPGEIGWHALAEQPLAGGDGIARQALRVDSVLPLAHVSAEAESIAGRGALRIGARGALVAVAGAGVHAAPPVADSVAVVEIDGVAGVAVYHENRYVGRTDGNGRLLVPGLLSHRPNRLTIDPLDLPLDAPPRAVEQTVRPGERAALALRFDLQRSARSALVALHDADGRPLPLGAQARLGDGAPAVVGHDGLVYLQGVGEHNLVQVRLADGSACTAQFGAPPAGGARIGPVTCAR